jgi:cbb3-type cytochrome oxidase cytochrome c subunit
MKRLLSAVLVSLYLVILAPVGPTLIAPSVSAQEKQVDPATLTVYVTKTGEKYHRESCRSLRQSKIRMSLKEAAKRYGPCSVCKPPTT